MQSLPPNNIDHQRNNMLVINGGEYTAGATQESSVVIPLPSARQVTPKKTGSNKRKFSEEQIRCLESMFESESRVEPGKKLQLARELGLQPRQVGIWFQNKRARCKSKQLERDLSLLRSNYNSLASHVHALAQEKHALLFQLHKLNQQLAEKQPKPQEDRQSSCRNSSTSDGNEIDPPGPLEDSQQLICERCDGHSGMNKAGFFGIEPEEEEEEEQSLLSLADPEPARNSLMMTSPDHWGSLESDHLLDQSSSVSQWWDFWS